MAEVNVNSVPIKPETPRIIDNEQLNVYVPNATDKYPGIASFDSECFVIDSKGRVRISPDVLADIEYSRKTIDDSEDNSNLVDGNNNLLETPDKKIIPAINSVYNKLNNVDIKVRDHESRISTNENQLENNERRISTNESKLENHESRISTNENQLENHESRFSEFNYEISELNRKIGTTDFAAGETLTSKIYTNKVAATNAFTKANKNEKLINALTAKVEGVTVSYSVNSFEDFINYLQGDTYVKMHVDTNNDGEYGDDEIIYIYAEDLKTGDNIYIVQGAVPDFWFERNPNIENPDYYIHDNVRYDLTVYDRSHNVIGTMHILETDFNVIAGYAISAGESATQAQGYMLATEQYMNQTEAIANSIYVLQIAPPLSLLSTAIVLTTPNLSQLT